MIEWVVAKRVRDLARNEPVNVGVIVWHGGQVLARFEDLRGADDAQHALHAQWIRYWTDCVAEARRLAAFAPGRPGDGYYLEPAGPLLTYENAPAPEDLLKGAYAELVHRPATDGTAKRLERAVDQLLVDSGLTASGIPPQLSGDVDQWPSTELRVRLGERSYDGCPPDQRVPGRHCRCCASPTRAHTPPEFGRIIFVPDRTASSTIEALERSATVAPVDQVTATDVREMFEHHSAR